MDPQVSSAPPDPTPRPAESAEAEPSRRRRLLATSDARAWVMFAGCVLIVAVLRWAEAVVVPIALALLLTFMLDGPVTYLQRWMRRAAAVGLVVTLTVVAALFVAWVFAYQLTSLADDLPEYRANIVAKIADIRGVGESRWVERLQATVEDIQEEIERPRPDEEAKPTPVVVTPEVEGTWWGLPAWTSVLFAPLGMLAVAFVLVTFMLIEYADLRDRLLAVVGYGYLANTTQAFDEAASRLSRYLTMQLLINSTYGVLATVGLWAIGVPYAMLWGVLGGLLRFVPYVGPWLGAGGPIMMSLAVFPGWYGPLWTVGLMIALELFTNLVLETLLYAGAAGVSQVALLVALAFWTWLWGPIGLLLGMPLTVCVVVLAKHVPALSVFRVLMTDAPALTPAQSYYQRVLAGRAREAEGLAVAYAKAHSIESTFEDVLLPALNFARRDRRDRRLSDEAECAVADTTRQLIESVAAAGSAERQLSESNVLADAEPPSTAAEDGERPVTRLRVLGYPAHGPTGDVALRMLAALCDGLAIEVDVAPSGLLVSELVDRVKSGGYQVVCIADLPPHSLSKVRHALGRLRQVTPDVRVIVGRWAPAGFAQDARGVLMEAGATEVATTLVGTRNQLKNLLTLVPAAAA